VLRAIQRPPDRITSYFTPPPVRYAARNVGYDVGKLVIA
jgi:hypothetical protein